MPNQLHLTLLAFLLFLAGTAYTQPPRGPYIISPRVHPDKTVTFAYLAPKALEVRLDGQFADGPISMEKDSQGIWRVTVGPVKPDIYPYSFRVDGVNVMDPANVDFFPNERFKGSLVNIPGDTPLVHAVQDVPHGKLIYDYYPSVEGSTGPLVVYTPPGYDYNRSVRYPVYYLISGTTDTEETWFKAGRANFILDNLIAAGKAKPMIVVMPYGNPAATVAAQQGREKPNDPLRESAEADERIQLFERDLMQHVIPYVDNNYRTIATRDARAIGGFSRGGGQTLWTAFGNMDAFSWICCYSAYLTTEVMETEFPAIAGDAKKTNESLRLLWVSVGDQDFLYDDTTEFMEYLKSHDVKFVSRISGGGHTWMNTKQYLAETATLLFK